MILEGTPDSGPFFDFFTSFINVWRTPHVIRYENCQRSVFSFLISCSFTAHSQNQDELMAPEATLNLQQIFEVANFFTVQIFAQVKYAFGSNEEGTSSGAGFLIDKKKGLDTYKCPCCSTLSRPTGCGF